MMTSCFFLSGVTMYVSIAVPFALSPAALPHASTSGWTAMICSRSSRLFAIGGCFSFVVNACAIAGSSGALGAAVGAGPVGAGAGAGAEGKAGAGVDGSGADEGGGVASEPRGGGQTAVI